MSDASLIRQPGTILGTSPALSVSGSAESIAQWFAVYTVPRHEKQVRRNLVDRGIESYLPLYCVARRWKNGCNVCLDLPLFPNYVFVRICRVERVRVLAVPGLVSLVGNGRQPCPLPEFEMESLRSGLCQRRFAPHPYLSAGHKVRIRAGALAGLEGVLVRWKGSFRVVLSLEMIMQSVAVEVAAVEIEPA